MSDTLMFFLGCFLPIVLAVAFGVIARAKPEWFEWLAGAPMPKKLKRKVKR